MDAEIYSSFRLAHYGLLITTRTQRDLKDSGIRLSPDQDLDPDRTYLVGLASMVLDLSEQYGADKVRDFFDDLYD